MFLFRSHKKGGSIYNFLEPNKNEEANGNATLKTTEDFKPEISNGVSEYDSKPSKHMNGIEKKSSKDSNAVINNTNTISNQKYNKDNEFSRKVSNGITTKDKNYLANKNPQTSHNVAYNHSNDNVSENDKRNINSNANNRKIELTHLSSQLESKKDNFINKIDINNKNTISNGNMVSNKNINKNYIKEASQMILIDVNCTKEPDETMTRDFRDIRKQGCLS